MAAVGAQDFRPPISCLPGSHRGPCPVAIAATLAELRPLRARIAQLAQGRQQILFVARGSSDNAAIYGRYLLEVHAGRTASMPAPSEATHYPLELDLSGALVVRPGQRQQPKRKKRVKSTGQGDNKPGTTPPGAKPPGASSNGFGGDVT